MRFNLPSIPSGCSLTGASLKLFATAAATGRTIDLYRAGGAWTENTVTWNTAPATAGTATSRASAASGRFDWGVTSQVQSDVLGLQQRLSRSAIRRRAAAARPQQTYQARETTPDTQDPVLRLTWR